jgi:GLPGLI family protein
MNKYCFILLIILGEMAQFSLAQNNFYTGGSIRFIRKTNAYRLTEGSWMNQSYEKNKFQTDTFTLDFDSSQSIYYNPSFDPDLLSFQDQYWSMSVNPTKSNVVYKNHVSDTLLLMRDLFDERIIIYDSIKNIHWKITGEYREIAGFTCRKVIGKLFDSMYVVAFYTDDIKTQDGPESFGNLPGMIMGLAIPRLFTSWMALDFKPTASKIVKPALPKRKKTIYNWNSYYLKLTERFKGWGPPFSDLMVWMWGV